MSPAARTTCLLVTLALALVSGRARSQYSGIAAGATAGAAAGVAAANATPLSAQPPQIVGRELEDWKDPGTQSTSRLSTSCGGVTAEVSVSGTGAKNYVNVTVRNGSTEVIGFAPGESVVRYANGTVRRLESDEQSDIAIQPGWLIHTFLAFQDKLELRGKNSLVIELNIRKTSDKACILPIELRRNTALPQPVSSYLPHTNLELEFYGGASFAGTGSLGKLAPPSAAAFGIHFAGFPWLHHGVSLDLALDFFRNREIERISPELRGNSRARLTGAGLLLGYVGRVFPAPWLVLSYRASIGPYALELNSDAEGGAEWTQIVFPLRHRVSAAVPVVRLRDGSSWYLSASVMQLYLPYGSSLGDAALRGSTLSGLVGIGLGG